jgi:hypothetical protein
MAKFSIYSQGLLIGHSLLESGDAPMGVALGAFKPAPGYETVQEFCKANPTDQSSLQLTVQTESGQVIPCAGVGILDFSEEPALSCIEVNVLGIPYPLYEQLFPQHVHAYEQQLK